MNDIDVFIKAICWAEWSQPSYNGVSVMQGENEFFKRLQNLYNSALISLAGIQDNGHMLDRLIEESEKLQRYFDPPTDELLQSIMNDYEQTGHQSLKDDYDYLVFVRNCMKIQGDFLAKFKDVVCKDKVEEVEPVKKENTHEIIKGVKGLAMYLQCGVTKAQAILNTGKLQKNGIAYRDGNTWSIDKNKLAEQLANDPELLSTRNLT